MSESEGWFTRLRDWDRRFVEREEKRKFEEKEKERRFQEQKDKLSKISSKENTFNEDEKENNFWAMLIFIILISTIVLIIAFYFFGNDEDKNEGKKYDSFCVDDCVIDADFCNLGSVSKYDYDDCKFELESCISDCGP